MQTGHTLKPIIILALGGLILSTVSWYGWLKVNDMDEPAVYGVVTEVATSSITIKNKREEVTVISLTEETAVFKNKTVVTREDITRGDFVQVTGTHVDDTTMDAETIRLMRPPKDTTSHE
jgi:hypothetical protein